MKLPLLVFSAFAAFAGVASAQSSMTVYGTIDLSAKYVKNDGSGRRLSLSQDGLNSSQLGFRGGEDLGGGLRAGFVLLAGVNADTGTANSKFWNRRSTVSLSGNFGEIRLGRDWTPTFWNQAIFEAFGLQGVGASVATRQLYGGTRMDNAIGYFLPSNLGGFFGQAMVAASEGGTALDKGGRYVGGRAGFSSGTYDVALALSDQRIDALGGVSQKTYNIGGSYDFGILKLLGYFDRDTLQGRRENMGSIGVVVPVGVSEVHIGVHRSKMTDETLRYSNTITQFALGYIYNLSKRTAVYATVARLSNGDHSNNSIATGTSQSAPPTLGGKSSGAELGLRHFF